MTGWPKRPPFYLGVSFVIDKKHIHSLLAPALLAQGYAIVRIEDKGGRRPILQIMLEKTGGASVTIDECAKASRLASAVLEANDAFTGAYVLEVSSPGIDRPLVTPADFVTYKGFEAKVEVDVPLDGRRRFRGTLQGLANDAVMIKVDGTVLSVPLARIAKAQLVLTDDLIAYHQQHVQPQPSQRMEG